jgi:hypothetical protein
MPADRVSTELAYHFKDGKRITGAHIGLEWQHVFEQTKSRSTNRLQQAGHC